MSPNVALSAILVSAVSVYLRGVLIDASAIAGDNRVQIQQMRGTRQ